MKKYFVFSFFFTLVLCRVLAQDIPPKPNPQRLVNDFAKQLNPTEVAELERKLETYNDSTSSQITIVIVPTTGEYPLADYALKLGREWGVGQKGKNNGIVILWASTDRKIYISVGYGMEGVIPDAVAKRIISQTITPEFKNKMFYRGLDRGVDEIFKYATGEYKADASPDDEGGSSSGLFIFLIIFFAILFIILRNRNNGGGSGGYRNAGGPVFFPFTTFSGGGGSSGSWGGGDGGFGGFGGGSFGGGGAGGDY